jgi:hypothetical protein
MSPINDLLDNLLDHLRPPLPPKSDTLAGHVPNLPIAPDLPIKDGFARDTAGIICQVQKDPNPNSIYNSKDKLKTTPLDGGDSAHRTGVAAFCNSALDQQLLHLFENTRGTMTRHPTQVPFNFSYSMNCSRDQLMGYAAGCWRARKLDITTRLLEAHAARNWKCQNIETFDPVSAEHGKKVLPDALAPESVMYLSICAGLDASYLDPLGQFSLQVAIQIAGNNVETDITNLMLQCVVCGRLDLFVKVHPNYKDALVYHWVSSRGGRGARAAANRGRVDMGD